MNPDAAQVRAMRAHKRMTQTQAARSVGVTLRAWQYWESGTKPMSLPAWRLFQRVRATNNKRGSEK